MLELIMHGIYDSNCYLLYDHPGGTAVIVDPGVLDTGVISAALTERNLRIAAVLNTHAHFDHTAGNPLLVTEIVPLALHPRDAALLAMRGGAVMFGLDFPQSPAATIDLSDNQVLTFGELDIHVIHTPGHTPGCVCFHLPDEGVLVSGDTLFHHGVGRTDLPGGNQQQLARSLERLLSLPQDTRVYPGHGEATTIAEERAHNPFLDILGITL